MTKSVPVSFDVQRFCRDRDVTSRWQRYSVEVRAGMTVLDGLLAIREQIDATLAWRFSCRMGICGSCGMVINGTPGLACNTQILDISDSLIRLQPLSNFAVAKDLVVDLAPMFDKHRAIKPFIVHSGSRELDAPAGEHEQAPGALMEYLQFAGCIKCGACMSACPTLATDDRFLGPMPLTAVQRYNADSRDDGFTQRRAAMSAFHGITHCHSAAECSRVCPKGVDPAGAIQRLKRDLVLGWLRPKRLRPKRLRPKRPTAPVSGPPPNSQRREDVPSAPAFTVER